MDKKKKKKKSVLFPNLKDRKKEWIDMPEFIQEKQIPIQTLIVYFESKKSIRKFSKRIGRKISPQTKSIWYPGKIRRFMNKRYIDTD